MREGGLAHARHVFQQQVAAGDQAGESQLDLARLAEQHLVDLRHGGVEAGVQGVIVEWSDRGHGNAQRDEMGQGMSHA
ncbi:hypothetical protein GCM10009429_27710 [Dyella marensis]